MDIRKYLVQLNSSGELVPLIYDKEDDKSNKLKKKKNKESKGSMCNKMNSDKKRSIRTKKPFVLSSDTQYALDFGQSDFDAIECKTCKMLYTKGEIEDEKHHLIYHDQFVNSPKFPPTWKVERTVVLFNNGDKIISIYPNDPKHMINKIEELVKIADHELGINSPFEQLLKHICFFLIYVTNNRRIGGFTAGEKIQNASPLISNQPFTISPTKQPAEVGIARLWIHESFRRQKFATRLVDILRANLYNDRIISNDKVAFSESTNCGIEFAKFYTNRNLLIYTSPT